MEDDQQFCLRWNNHQSTLISVFDTLLENQTLVDCTLAAEGKFLKAHKVVLSACSPFFATLLQQQYDKHPIFILKDVKYQELRAMMDYMYRGEVNISQDQLAALLKAAESLQIKGLSDNRSGSTPKTEQHRGLNVPGSGSSIGGGGKLSGYTLEQTQSKRPRVGPSPMETADISGSREGSSSPSRRRRKVRRRSVENAMSADVHDNSNSSQINQSSLQPQQQQQPQTNASLTGVGALAAATSSLPVSASALSTGSSGVLAATGSIVSTQGTTQQMTTNITKKTESVKGASDAMNSENIPTVGVVGTGDEQNVEHLKGEKSNHKQKSSAPGVAGKETAEMVIEPKSEYEEEGNEETVEDLTLDDEEMGMDDLDQNAGTSQAGEGSSQGYAPWQHDRSQDELLLAPQEAQQRDPQGTSDGYWTILETVPYSLQNTATNATGTISSMANTQLPVQQHQALHHQQDEGNSSEANLLAGATVVVEIPTETMRNAIKYTIPEAEHQLLHTAESTLATAGTKQRIHIVKDMRLNPTVTVAQQTNITATHVEQSNRQQSTQQHFTLNDCLSTGVVVQQHHHHHHHPQRQQTTQQQQTEFIKIDTIQEKMMLRNVIQYDAVDGLPADTSQVISALVESEKQQQQQRQQQQQQQQQEVLRNTRELELLDKAAIEAVSDTVLNAFEQQEAEHIEEHKSQNHEPQDKQLLPLMHCPTKILVPNANEVQLQYVCNLCGKSYKIKGSLKRHKRYECGVAPTVACQFCPHKCKYKSDLRKHVSQKHAGHSGEDMLLDQRLSTE
ncbi:longitudinals lacking protein, isoforms A/B/D/L-like isoform X3 [Bactrocera neohumeralis]|uniref:longitudinals lacking protein, isoforms A/B/D/L-like isoform X3 n=1 Tax=Bactrocera neohumeralis TaxID=98809 RepID=UPI002165E406|nr:longitudinals lacking protein, isoforms A/B/D/L-like isoform X3 [Bactrocera neohumeralis]